MSVLKKGSKAYPTKFLGFINPYAEIDSTQQLCSPPGPGPLPLPWAAPSFSSQGTEVRGRRTQEERGGTLRVEKPKDGNQQRRQWTERWGRKRKGKAARDLRQRS